MTLKNAQRYVGYILLGVLFAFAIYSNVRLGIRNYQVRQTIETTKVSVVELERRRDKIQYLLSFYQTKEYQEVEAKRRLGLKRPDETAILVSGLPANSLTDTLEDFVYREPTPPAPVQETNLQRWWKYLRGEYAKKG